MNTLRDAVSHLSTCGGVQIVRINPVNTVTCVEASDTLLLEYRTSDQQDDDGVAWADADHWLDDGDDPVRDFAELHRLIDRLIPSMQRRRIGCGIINPGQRCIRDFCAAVGRPETTTLDMRMLMMTDRYVFPLKALPDGIGEIYLKLSTVEHVRGMVDQVNGLNAAGHRSLRVRCHVDIFEEDAAAQQLLDTLQPGPVTVTRIRR